MNSKIVAIILVAIAVIAGSISAVIVTTKRADIARAKLEIATSKEDAARQNRKAKEKEADAEKAKLATAELEQKNLQDKKQLVDAETKKNESEEKLVAEERKLAEAKADEAEELKQKAAIVRESQRQLIEMAELTNKNLQAQIRLAETKARAESTRLEAEKLKHEREVSAVKAKELNRIRFEEWEQQLIEWKQNLEERERAIAPEKTSAELNWVGDGEDSVLDEKGNVVRQPKQKYLAENDRTLSPTTRELAKTLRLREEASEARRTAMRDAIVAALEKLYVQARETDRPLDAEYYRKSIKVMYPDWKYQPATNVTAKAEEKQNGGK